MRRSRKLADIEIEKITKITIQSSTLKTLKTHTPNKKTLYYKFISRCYHEFLFCYDSKTFKHSKTLFVRLSFCFCINFVLFLCF